MKHRQNVFLGKLRGMRRIGRVVAGVALVCLAGCSAGDPPSPEAAGLGPPPEDVADAMDEALDATEVCAAVRAAGFADVQVDIDGTVSPCP